MIERFQVEDFNQPGDLIFRRGCFWRIRAIRRRQADYAIAVARRCEKGAK